ncbi:hypothetical protein [Parasitella parasitica]|uniref:WW domain-containing protein n=1 Tax=Parasitella parasitica TaxID=35722 RepID=A0A0B7NH81_9FUNG|nr:hypothetical protein [Parasitella parasitica]
MSVQLPPGWEEKFTPEGRPYYVDHNTRSTHWQKPALAPPAYGNYNSPPPLPTSRPEGFGYPPQLPQNGAPYPPQQQQYSVYPPQQSPYGNSYPQQRPPAPPPQASSYGGGSYPPPQHQPSYGSNSSYPSQASSYGNSPQQQQQQRLQQNPQKGYPAPQGYQPGYPAQQGYPPKSSGISPGMKMAGAAAAGIAGGLVIGGIMNHEQEQNDRIERLEQEQRDLEYQQHYQQQPSYNPPPPIENQASDGGYGNYNPGDYPQDEGGNTQTTIIREDGGWFGADKETVITTDEYGGQTITERKDGWFDNDVQVTNIDPDGNTTYEEYDEDNSGFFD